MSRGKRYDTEQKLNLKKVFAVIIAFAVIAMFVVAIGKILKTNPNKLSKAIPNHYFSVYTNGKWGVMNSAAEQVIAPEYAEMIVIPNKEKAVFLCVYDVDYLANNYKTKAINSNGETLFSEYENVEPLINYNSNKLWYEQNLLKVQKDGKYGLIDFSGKVICECSYDKIELLKGVINSIVTVKDGKYGLIDTLGNVIINNEYKNILPLTDNYADGYIVINSDNKYGVINSNKELVVECKYEDVKNIAYSKYYVVKANGTYKIVDSDKNTYLDGKCADIKDINENYVIAKDKKLYGVYNLNGDLVISADYQDLSFTFANYFIAEKDNKYGIIDSTNTVVVDFTYSKMEYNESASCIVATNDAGIINVIDSSFAVKLEASQVEFLNGFAKAKISNCYKYYNFKFEEKSNKDVYTANTLFVDCKDGKYGFVDKDGKVIVDYKYEDATEQNDYGYASIKLDGKWGAVDQYGNVVVEPKYELVNNTLIDFIGKWHVSEDLYANYYTDM